MINCRQMPAQELRRADMGIMHEGGAALLPQLPVALGRSSQRGHRVRQEHPGLRQPGPQRPGHAAEVRRDRGAHHHDGAAHEQRRHAHLLRPDLHDPRVPQEPAQALLRDDGAQVRVLRQVQHAGAGRQRHGSVPGRHHLERRWGV